MSDTPQTQPPGWYHAQGDPPETQRYWDGTQWQGGPQPVPGAGQPGPGMVGSGGSPTNLASPWSRLLGRIIDFLILVIPMIVITAIFGAGFYGVGGGDVSLAGQFIAGLLTTLIALGYEFYFLTKQGATPGKKAANVLVVLEDGSPITQDATLRRLVLPALQVIPILGGIIGLVVGIATVIMIFVDDRRQVPHDKLAKTLVVSTKAS